MFFPLRGTEIQVQGKREDFGKVEEETECFSARRRCMHSGTWKHEDSGLVQKNNECFFPLGDAVIQVQGNMEDSGEVQAETDVFSTRRRCH